MVDLQRVRVGWTGGPGGNGVSTFYCVDIAQLWNAIATFFNDVFDYVPDDFTYVMPTEGDTINYLTGELVGSWQHGAGGGRAGTVAGPYASPVGAMVTWTTGAVVNGHRLNGKTYLVPLGSASFDDHGTLDDTILADLNAISDALVAAGMNNLAIWSRPTPGHPGGYATVMGSTVKDKAAVLRSRRD